MAVGVLEPLPLIVTVAEGERESVPVAVGVRVQLILADGVDAAVFETVPERVCVAVPLTVPDSLIVAVRVHDGVTDAVMLAEEEGDGVLEVLTVTVAD